MQLECENIKLRLLEAEDFDFLYRIENDKKYWNFSNTTQPFSAATLKNYISNAHQDIKEAHQLRFVIVTHQHKQVGFIDLFDFDPIHQRAGIGILIEESQQGNGYGKEALGLLIKYAFDHLHLHQLYANVEANNKISLNLFKKYKFKAIGTKPDWLKNEEGHKNEILLQLIN